IRLDAPGGPFENYQFESQGDVGDCYAFMSAKLTDAWRFKNGIDQRQSSGFASAMIISANDPLSRDLDGNFGCDALLWAVEHGGCSFKSVTERMGGRDPKVADELGRLLKLYRKVDRHGALYSEKKLDRMEGKICRVAKKLLGPAGDEEMEKCNILDSTSQSTGTKFIYDLLLKEGCSLPENQLKISSPLMKVKWDVVDRCDTGPVSPHDLFQIKSLPKKEAAFFAQKGALDAIDTALLDTKPAGIGFCATFLRKPGSVGINWNGDRYSPDLATCGGHAAAVIGRRKEKEKCQYLIYNSWEVRAGDGGKQWVDADDLARNLMQVYRLRY
ncbi:MAG: hypothetical protein AAB425_02870, partial [Bdellovibrionota bacterium]